MTIIEESDLGAVGKELLENLKEIKESVSEVRRAQFKKKSTFEDTQHFKEYVGYTIDMIKNNLSKLQEKRFE